MLSWRCIILTHWGRVTYTCVGKLTIIASDNGLSPGRRQAIIWTYDGILLIGPLGTKFNEISIEIHTFSFKKMHLKMSSAKWRPFCVTSGNTPSALRFRESSAASSNEATWSKNMIRKLQMAEGISWKTCVLCSQHYAFWWPSTVMC